KEEWIYRVLNGRSIVFCADIMNKTTTLTYGFDVSNAIASLIGKADAKRNSFNVTTRFCITWGEVLDIYTNVILEETGKRPKIVLLSLEDFLKCKPYGKYQIIYDRLFDRKFENSKIQMFTEINWRDPREGLESCLRHFIATPEFLKIDWQLEAIKDRFSGQCTPLWKIKGYENKIKYLLKR